MNKGFTLVELAIVIVIIGLLVGGVMQGQELIKSSERNKVFTEFVGFEAASIIFKGKYNAIAGDFNQAELMFGTSSMSCPNGSSIIGTCNGDGNGQFSGNEGWRFWQQLALAKLILGSYTGITDTAFYSGTACRSTPEVNVPKSAIGKKIGYELAGPTFYGITSYGIKAGKCKLANNLNQGVLSAEDARNMDMKFDDGTPDRGKLVAGGEFGVGGCTNRNDDITTYTTAIWAGLTDSRELCLMHYLINP